MKKIVSVVFTLMICLSISACGINRYPSVIEDPANGSRHTEEPAETDIYVIPKSYWDYAGSTLEEAAESIRKLGSDYCTDAQVISDGVQLELTKQQRDNLIQRNNEYHDQIISEFMSYSDDYWFEPDETYQTINLYFDEKLPPVVNIKTVFMLTAGYGMNYILKNNTVDWNVKFSIYNCHTNKLVISANFPDEEATCGPDEWKASYEE